MTALAYPDGLRRIRPARVIRTATRAPTEPIVFVVPSRDDLARMWAAYLGARP